MGCEHRTVQPISITLLQLLKLKQITFKHLLFPAKPTSLNAWIANINLLVCRIFLVYRGRQFLILQNLKSVKTMLMIKVFSDMTPYQFVKLVLCLMIWLSVWSRSTQKILFGLQKACGGSHRVKYLSVLTARYSRCLDSFSASAGCGRCWEV